MPDPLTPLASLEQFDAFLPGGGVPDDQTDRALATLDGASTLVRSHTRRTWLDSEGFEEFDENDELIWSNLRTVTLQVAGRVFTNPKGFIQETSGPFSGTRDRRVGEGYYLTDPEEAMLDQALKWATEVTAASGLWVQPTTRGSIETTYVPVEGSDKPIPADVPG